MTTIKEFFIKFLELIGLAFWIEVVTDEPTCIYYFGPFLTKQEAQMSQSGYIEDLQNEGTKGINATIKRCKPTTLTIFEDLDEISAKPSTPTMTKLSYEV